MERSGRRPFRATERTGSEVCSTASWAVLLLFSPLLISASLPQQLKAMEKQAGEMGAAAAAIAAIAEEVEVAGRPQRLAPLKSESVRLDRALSRLSRELERLEAMSPP